MYGNERFCKGGGYGVLLEGEKRWGFRLICFVGNGWSEGIGAT